MNSLLLKFAKLNVVRNIAVAFVIALASTAITWVVNWKAQQNQAPPPAPIVAIAPAVPMPVSSTINESAADFIPKVIPAPEHYEELIEQYMRSNPSQVVNYFEGEEQVFLYSVPIETNSNYKHKIQLYKEHRTHYYNFEFGCGCKTNMTPDSYRNVIYADPERIAAKYAAQLCRDCTKLQAVLDARKADSSDSQQAE